MNLGILKDGEEAVIKQLGYLCDVRKVREKPSLSLGPVRDSVPTFSAINPNPNTPRSSNTADPFFGLIPTKEEYEHFAVSCATPKHTEHNRQLSEVHLRSNTCKVYASAAGELCAIDQRREGPG